MQAALFAACIGVAQQPFELDTAFRTQIDSWNVNSVAVLADGALLLSGQIKFPGDMSFRGSARIFADGQQDTSFPTFPLTTGGSKITPWNDQFYVSNGLVRRLLPTGLIDPSFIMMNDGPYFNSFEGGDYHVFPDGRVVLGGSHYLSDTARGFVGFHELIWFSNTGYLDTTRIHRDANGTLRHLRELPDGKFICRASATVYEGQAIDRIFRVHPDGALDTTFDTGVNLAYGNGFHPMPDGRVYATGRFHWPGLTDTLHVVRFMPDGSLDPTFNNTVDYRRSPLLSFGQGAILYGIQAIDENHLLVFGSFEYVAGQQRKGICMIKNNGDLYAEYFADAGCGNYNYNGVNYASIAGVVQAPDSSWYVWGAYHGYDDGTTNDTLQRMVSHLYPMDFTTGQVHVRDQDPQMRIYPNPASSTTTVSLEQLPRDAVLVLRDALGREVQRRKVREHYTVLNLNSAWSGVYTLEVWDINGRIASERVVVE